MAEGVVFGNFLLPKELFIPIFEEWYKQRKENFKQSLQVEIIDVIEKMIKTGTRIDSKGKLKSTTIKIKDQYNAKKIYETWDKITQDYFGNGSVTLIAATKFEGSNFKWTANLDEKMLVNEKGINIRRAGLKELEENNKDIQTIFLAAEIQDLINNHFDNLVKALDTYNLTKEDARDLHILLAERKSKLNRPGFTNSTYNKIIFGGQKNATGKQLDAYMNHMGNYHNELFDLMSQHTMANANSLANITHSFHDDFYSIFENKRQETQTWLLDSLNSASWLTGGDIIVVGENGSIIYNIQLKTTGRGKTFEVASTSLLAFAKKMLQLINEDASPKELAELMFQQLKTSSANEIDMTEKFLEQKGYELVEQNLKLKTGSLSTIFNL